MPRAKEKAKKFNFAPCNSLKKFRLGPNRQRLLSDETDQQIPIKKKKDKRGYY